MNKAGSGVILAEDPYCAWVSGTGEATVVYETQSELGLVSQTCHTSYSGG